MANILKLASRESPPKTLYYWTASLSSYYDHASRSRVSASSHSGCGIDDLLDLVKSAYENSASISIDFDIEPTDSELTGEPAVSADEMWRLAFDQKRRLSA